LFFFLGDFEYFNNRGRAGGGGEKEARVSEGNRRKGEGEQEERRGEEGKGCSEAKVKTQRLSLEGCQRVAEAQWRYFFNQASGGLTLSSS
jgi:hypothetical protein